MADTVETVRYARTHPVVAALLGSKLGFGFGTGSVGMLAAAGHRAVPLGRRGHGPAARPPGGSASCRAFVARRLLAPARRGRAAPETLASAGILLACGVAGIVYGAVTSWSARRRSWPSPSPEWSWPTSGGGAQWTLSTYGLQAAVPDYIRGRVFAADLALVTVTMSVSLVASGALAEVTGPRLPTGAAGGGSGPLGGRLPGAHPPTAAGGTAPGDRRSV